MSDKKNHDNLPHTHSELTEQEEIKELKKSVYEAFRKEGKHYKSSPASLERIKEPLGLDIVIESNKEK